MKSNDRSLREIKLENEIFQLIFDQKSDQKSWKPRPQVILQLIFDQKSDQKSWKPLPQVRNSGSKTEPTAQSRNKIGKWKFLTYFWP